MVTTIRTLCACALAIMALAWNPGEARAVQERGGPSDVEVDTNRTATDTKPSRPPRKTAEQRRCERSVNGEKAYLTYARARNRLLRSVDPGKIWQLDCFLPGLDEATPSDALERFSGTVFDANVLHEFLRERFDALLEETRAAGQERDGGLAWGTRNLGLAALIAYRNTGDERFVALFIDYFGEVMDLRDEVLGWRDDYHGRIMSAWGTAGSGVHERRGTGKWVVLVTHFATIMKPATGFARVIRDTPELSALRSFAEEVIAFFERAYPEFDTDLRPAPGSRHGWYWRPYGELFEATNHVHILGETLLDMHALTGKGSYAQRVQDIIDVFEKGVTIDEQGWIAWTYFPHFQAPDDGPRYIHERHSEVVWKASLTVPFLYQAVADGFDIDPEIMQATTRTIREHVIGQGGYANNIHPRDSGSILAFQRKPHIARHGPTTSIVGFLAASSQDPTIRDVIRNTIATRRDLFPHGWLRRAERTAHDQMPLGYAHMLGAEAPATTPRSGMKERSEARKLDP